MTSSNPPRTAAALVIGNELLTGKIQDANVAVLARDLFGLGIALRRVVFCPDEVDVISEDLNALRRRPREVDRAVAALRAALPAEQIVDGGLQNE